MKARPGLFLALETSGPVGSVAVALDGTVRARRFLTEARTHAARVLPAMEACLREIGGRPGDIEGVIVGAGPGSFTGVRVAAATAKGLIHGLGCPLWAVSSLAAAALTPEALPRDVGPWPSLRDRSLPANRVVAFDARGRRIFLAAYDVGEQHLRVDVGPCFSTLDELLARPSLQAHGFCGEAALRHRCELEEAGRCVLPAPAGWPTADALFLCLARAARKPLSDPRSWEPDYLRATGAERQRHTRGSDMG